MTSFEVHDHAPRPLPGRDWPRTIERCALLLAIALLAVAATMLAMPAHAAGPGGAARQPEIPARSAIYRLRLQHEAQAVFGPGAPVARFAAQIHQESRWRADAVSPVGATGLTQFMPATAEWLREVCPRVGPPNPLDPDWAIRAMICYDQWLLSRVTTPATDCDAWAFALSAYNGGERWVRRDRAEGARLGRDPARWFGHVADTPDPRRRASAVAENRGYVQRILRVLEPTYIRAGWPGQAACP